MHHHLVMKFSCFLNPWAGDIGRGGYINMWYSFIQDKEAQEKLDKSVYIQRYKDFLYSDDRMKTKTEAFRQLFLPSLLERNLGRKDWTLYIFTTQHHMPRKYTEWLYSTVAGIPQIQIVDLTTEPYDDNEYIEYVERECEKHDDWSIIWLGDDDAMNPEHLQLVSDAAELYKEPFVYTMPNLKTVSFDAHYNLIHGKDYKSPNVHGLALTGVRVNPLRLGAHYRIPELADSLKIVYNEEDFGGVLFCDEKFTASRRAANTTHINSRKFEG